MRLLGASNPRLMNVTHAAFRIGVGVLFLQHGLQKIFGLLGGRQVELASLMGLAGVFELVGGVLLIAGLLTRPVAAALAVEMLAAFGMAHLPKGGWPIQNGGELPLLFALAFVFLAGHGAGAYSLDAWLTRRRSRAARIDILTRRAA